MEIEEIEEFPFHLIVMECDVEYCFRVLLFVKLSRENLLEIIPSPSINKKWEVVIVSMARFLRTL